MTGLSGMLHWMEETSWSTALRESIWAYPIVETTHVLGLCLFLGLAVLLDLRLLGSVLRRTRVSDVVARLMPWMWAGFALMVVTGVLLFFSDPVRFSENVFFRVKLGLLAIAGVNAWIFHVTVYRRVQEWDDAPSAPVRARVAAGVSLTAWIGVVFTGRLIAYNWF